MDLRDFAAFQNCVNSTDPACLCRFDAGPMLGMVEAGDLTWLVPALTGPTAGGGRGGAPMGGSPEEGGSPSEPPPPPEDPWTYEEAEARFCTCVSPAAKYSEGTLTAQTTYEVWYEAEWEAINDYMLFGIATSADQGLSNGTAPVSGDWSSAGNFTFVDLEEEWGAAVQASGYPADHFRYQMATDWFTAARTVDRPPYARSSGHLCNITTNEAGELNLHLYLMWIDEDRYHLVEMEAHATFGVLAPITDEPATDE